MQKALSIQSLTIIGPGNVGWHLAHALKEAGYEIRNIVSRNPQNLESMGKILDERVISDLNQTIEEPDLYIITVPDAEIASVVASLADSESIVVHTAGGMDLSVFKDKKDKFGVFYPLQSFTKGTEMRYADIPFLLEADCENTMKALEEVAQKISGSFRRVSAEERIKLHIAAVYACNFSNHMLTIADYLLKKEDQDLSLMLPLLRQTIKKLDALSPKEAQTGPAIRKDQHTINKHLDLLADEPELKELYKAISQSIQKKIY